MEPLLIEVMKVRRSCGVALSIVEGKKCCGACKDHVQKLESSAFQIRIWAEECGKNDDFFPPILSAVLNSL